MHLDLIEIKKEKERYIFSLNNIPQEIFFNIYPLEYNHPFFQSPIRDIILDCIHDGMMREKKDLTDIIRLKNIKIHEFEWNHQLDEYLLLIEFSDGTITAFPYNFKFYYRHGLTAVKLQAVINKQKRMML